LAPLVLEVGDVSSSQFQLQTEFIFKIMNLLAYGRVRDMEPMGGSPETQFFSHGDEITQVTQLHNYLPYPVGKRFLPIWQEMSNRRGNKPSHCFLQSPKKLNSAWARTGRRELPQEHNHMSASSWRWRENRVREEVYKQQLKNMSASTNGKTRQDPSRVSALIKEASTKEPTTKPAAKGKRSLVRWLALLVWFCQKTRAQAGAVAH
jgi:hypothetical protein